MQYKERSENVLFNEKWGKNELQFIRNHPTFSTFVACRNYKVIFTSDFYLLTFNSIKHSLAKNGYWKLYHL